MNDDRLRNLNFADDRFIALLDNNGAYRRDKEVYTDTHREGKTEFGRLERIRRNKSHDVCSIMNNYDSSIRRHSVEYTAILI